MPMENIDVRESFINKSPENEKDSYNFFFDYEFLGEIFEKDSLRYKRYLGDDLLKEQLI